MQQPDYSISTPENVDLHLEVAGIGNRMLAQLIDSIILLCIMTVILVIGVLAAVGVSMAQIDSKMRSVFFAIIAMVAILAMFVIQNGYFFLFEALWQGQTPGKKAAEIRVIEQNGQPIGWPAAIIRNLMRIIDNLMFLGILFILFDKKERRLGDMAAGTMVIRERKTAISANQLPMTTAATADSGLDVGKVSPAEYDLLIDFLRRRTSLAKAHRPEVAQRMAQHFKARLDGHSHLNGDEFGGGHEGAVSTANPIEKVDNPEQFLESLYLTYQQRAAE